MKPHLLVGFLATLSLCLAAGCTVNSQEKAILAGTWQAEGAAFPLTTFLVFDDAGNPDQLITRPTDDTDLKDDLTGTRSSVDGSDVTFAYSLPILGTQSFVGTISDDGTTLTGQMTLTTRIFLTTITTELGEVTLTKVEDEP